MDPIEFEGMTGKAAEHQEEYRTLPMYRDETQVISCWQLTPEELEKVKETGQIWLSVHQPGNTLICPTLLSVEKLIPKDAWIIWTPDSKVPEGLVEIECRNRYRATGDSKQFDWSHGHAYADIIKYRFKGDES